MKSVLLQPTFVLHKRPYRETSYLVELFTLEYGRLTLIAKGIRKPRSLINNILQPFTPLLISWVGKGELKILSPVEIQEPAFLLQGECLFAGFYLNELLMCLLEKWDAYPSLYYAYQTALVALRSNILDQKVLRIFEKRLLEELGYGLFPKKNIFLPNTIMIDKYYRFIPGEGLTLNELSENADYSLHIFSGKNLMAIANEEWTNEDCLRDAKRLTRLILQSLLGEKLIHSRRLFNKLM